MGREQRLEQGQEAGSGAAGNAGSSGEGGEQGPGLLFHFFLERKLEEKQKKGVPSPKAFGESPLDWGREWGSLEG